MIRLLLFSCFIAMARACANTCSFLKRMKSPWIIVIHQTSVPSKDFSSNCYAVRWKYYKRNSVVYITPFFKVFRRNCLEKIETKWGSSATKTVDLLPRFSKMSHVLCAVLDLGTTHALEHDANLDPFCIALAATLDNKTHAYGFSTKNRPMRACGFSDQKVTKSGRIAKL